MDDEEMSRDTDAGRIEILNRGEVFHIRLYEDPEHKRHVLLSYRANVGGLSYTDELPFSRPEIKGVSRMLKSPDYRDYKNARIQLEAILSAYKTGRMGSIVRRIKRRVKISLDRILRF